jgi:hypothetical protein
LAATPVATPIVVSVGDDSLGFTFYAIETRLRRGATAVVVRRRFSEWYRPKPRTHLTPMLVHNARTVAAHSRVTVMRRRYKLHAALQPGLIFPEKKRLFHSSAVKQQRAELLQQYLCDVLRRGRDTTALYAFLNIDEVAALEERLATLQDMLSRGTLTAAEYAEKRQSEISRV